MHWTCFKICCFFSFSSSWVRQKRKERWCHPTGKLSSFCPSVCLKFLPAQLPICRPQRRQFPIMMSRGELCVESQYITTISWQQLVMGVFFVCVLFCVPKTQTARLTSSVKRVLLSQICKVVLWLNLQHWRQSDFNSNTMCTYFNWKSVPYMSYTWQCVMFNQFEAKSNEADLNVSLGVSKDSL